MDKQLVLASRGAALSAARQSRDNASASLCNQAGDIFLSTVRCEELDTTWLEHTPTSATGTTWERTPWRATQRAAWEALDCAAPRDLRASRWGADLTCSVSSSRRRSRRGLSASGKP